MMPPHDDSPIDPDTLASLLGSEIPDDSPPVVPAHDIGNNDEIERLRTALARSQADYHNLSSRIDRDRADMSFFLEKKYALAFLPLADNLERAVKHLPQDIAEHPWVSGIRATQANLMKTFASLGIEGFDSLGQEVDPSHHDVIAQTNGPTDTIIDEYERGYTLNGQVLRHAKVIVGNGTLSSDNP